MNRRAPALSIPIATTMLACGGAMHWQAVCGCGSLWEMVANDLGYTKNIGESSVTPEFLVRASYEKVQGKAHSLETVRAIGPFFNNNCVQIWNNPKCVFFMWEGDHKQRGIELTFHGDAMDQMSRVTGRYVIYEGE